MRIINGLLFILLVIMTACSVDDSSNQASGINVKLLSTDAVSARVLFEPYTSNAYIASCITEDDFKRFGGDMGTIRSLYDNTDTSSHLLRSGNSELFFDELRPNTRYYAVAFEVTEYGEAGNVLYKQEFLTHDSDEMQLNDVSFELSVSDVTFESASIECIPSDLDVEYYLGVIDEKDYIKWNIKENGYGEYFFHLIDQEGYVLDDLWVSGNCQKKLTRLEGETNYHVFAFTVSASGTITSVVSETTFTTEISYFIDASFSLSATDIMAGSARINAIPVDDRIAYYYGIVEKKIYETYESDFDLMDDIIKEKGAYFENFVVKGTDSYYEYGLTPDTPYYIIAFAYDKTTPTGYNSYLSKSEFRTKSK